MPTDIRDRIICTAFSAIASEKEIRSSMAVTSEQDLRGCVLDLSSIVRMKNEASEHKNIFLAINFPFSGIDEGSCLELIKKSSEFPFIKNIYVSLDKFIVQKPNMGELRSFIQKTSALYKHEINYCLEYCWLKNKETVDKVCSILEPYERHGLVISTYSKKPDKLSEITAIGKHLNSNGSCKYSYFGAIPSKKEGVVEILSSGFAYCAMPRQFLGPLI